MWWELAGKMSVYCQLVPFLRKLYWYSCASNLYSNTLAEIRLFQLPLQSNLELFICLEIRWVKRVFGWIRHPKRGFKRTNWNASSRGANIFQLSTIHLKIPDARRVMTWSKFYHTKSSSHCNLVLGICVPLASWSCKSALFCSTCCCLWTWTLKICCSPHLS